MDAVSVRQRKLRLLLRAVRRERGVTQVQLAERLNLPQSVISKSERGERQLLFVDVQALCEALGVSLGTFCRRLESTPEDYEGE